eukprot:scaffold192268_cov36-Cyclotella_meneghiniana.AAC.2
MFKNSITLKEAHLTQKKNPQCGIRIDRAQETIEPDPLMPERETSETKIPKREFNRYKTHEDRSIKLPQWPPSCIQRHFHYSFILERPSASANPSTHHRPTP